MNTVKRILIWYIVDKVQKMWGGYRTLSTAKEALATLKSDGYTAWLEEVEIELI